MAYQKKKEGKNPKRSQIKILKRRGEGRGETQENVKSLDIEEFPKFITGHTNQSILKQNYSQKKK